MDASQILRDQVSAALWQHGEESLVDVCRYLKCDGMDSGESCSRAWRSLIEMAEFALDKLEEKQESDEVKLYCADLLTFIERQSKRCSRQDEEYPSEEPAPKEGLEKCFSPHTSFLKTTDSPFKSRLEQTRPLPEVTLQREFKICGQIEWSEG